MSIHPESPCPDRPGSHAQYDTLFSGCQDDTLDHFEYTRAIDFAPQPRPAALTRSKPRRVVRSSFDIREDVNIEHGQDTTTAVLKTLKRKTQDRKLSILAQPAQRFQRPRISSTQAVNNAPPQNSRTVTIKDQPVQESQPHQLDNRTRLSQKSTHEDGLKKDVRRRTVYIPTDDTTMPTVFLSLFSPLKSKDANSSIVNAMEETTSLYSLEARIAAKRRSTKTDKTEQEKTPLGPTKLTTQQPAVHHDVMGKNGGKENIPPGYYGDKRKGIGQNQFPLQPQVVSKKPLNPASRASGNTEVRKSLSKRNLESGVKPLGHKSSKILSTVPKLSNPDTLSLKKSGSKGTDAVAPLSRSQQPLQEPQIEKAQFQESLRWSLPKSRSISVDQRYPVLKNDISNPIMYEENWLAHQEIVITQLVNGLFDSSVNDPPTHDPEILRHELLKVYQSDACILLYRRLQASIFNGALAPPKETLRQGSCLGNDLGMKRSFLSFWTDTYDLNVLRAASETVIGRKMTLPPVSADQKSSNVAARQHKALKRAVETFLETFLIRNLDKGDNEDSQEKVDGKPYGRTLLRSMMLIILLDKARSTPGNSLPKRLFVKNSQHKSSSATMQALANLLLPSMGDINRQINHLNCILHFSQHQLQDYDYRIQNLAVDLRDGVLLTRLVEILLYSDRSHVIDREDSDDAPFVHEASPVVEVTEWPLSRKLKLPCASRVAKCLNVQIALDALKGVVGGNDLLQDVSAEHIVDGYREKTLALLWVLVGKWGLAEMLDWNDVRSEILRLRKKFQLFQGHCGGGKCEPALNFQSHEDLLIDWATSLAKLKGLRVDNLTTSFADGRIFNSIVDEYEAFLPRPRDAKHGSSLHREETKVKHGQESLQARLQALGCNSQFASLVAGTTSASRIFDRDVVIGALTFLCSRLLSPTKRVRAAIVIQKAWRQTMSARNAQRRILVKEIAEQCAAVACTRERISWAKSVILKWWREQKKEAEKDYPRKE